MKDSNPIRVVVHGATGKMGREVLSALCLETELKAVGAVDLDAKDDFLPLPDGSGRIPFSSNLEQILNTTKPDVLVDFTIARAAIPAVRLASKHSVNLVIGTSGLSPDNLKEIDELAKASQVGAVVAPNFAIGAVLMIYLARIAARHLNTAEIIELHHDQKADAPSGTAIATARAMAAAREKPFPTPPQPKNQTVSRGEQVENIPIHSIRLQGFVAHQEVIFGGPGQTLTIRHDTTSRQCFMPGVMLAIKEIGKYKGLVYGLDTLLNLQEIK